MDGKLIVEMQSLCTPSTLTLTHTQSIYRTPCKLSRHRSQVAYWPQNKIEMMMMMNMSAIYMYDGAHSTIVRIT